jgi:predicted DNA-binding transcriptional regulator AlpA
MITVKEATAKAGCTDVTIYKALKDGDLKGQKMGPRRTMVWVASLDAWIAARKSPAAPSADPPPAPPKRRGRPPKVAARIPLSSILHSPASPPLPYESRPRHNGEASPINPARFQPHD